MVCKLSKKGRHISIPYQAVTSAAPAIVPYTGEGTYGTQGSSVVRWTSLPPDELPEGSLLDLQVQEWQENQSWWPVVTLQLHSDPLWGQEVLWVATCGLTLVVCIHQGVQTPIWGWFANETGFVELPDDPEWID